MRPSCPRCGYVYEREPGYFLGAVVFSYFIACFSVVPTVLLSEFVFILPLWGTIALASAQVILLTPVIFRLSRLLWIHLDYRSDPDEQKRGTG